MCCVLYCFLKIFVVNFLVKDFKQRQPCNHFPKIFDIYFKNPTMLPIILMVKYNQFSDLIILNNNKNI